MLIVSLLILVLIVDRFQNTDMKDRVTRIVLLWVNNHFTDFETNNVMMNFLEHFEECLQEENMTPQLNLLNMACTAKARIRCVTLTRSDRNEPLNFLIVGGFEKSCGIFISMVSYSANTARIKFEV